MKFSAKLASLLFGFITLSVSEIDLINVPIIGRTVKFSTKVSAQTVRVYLPPVGPSRESRTTGTGSRGCDRAGDTKLQLLVPDDHLPLTISERPTFFWYVSDTSLPVRFTLVEPGVAEPIVDRTFKIKRPGIVQITLPADASGLALNKEYRWTVSLVCNKERPSENTYAYSSIKRVAVTPALRSKLAGISQKEERSLVYAQSGIWYDALDNSFISYKNNTQSKVAKWYFSKLLTQVGLPAVSEGQLQHPNTISSQ